jgi:hypothetical protein
MTSNDRKFIEHVKSECVKYGVKCDLRAVKYLKYSSSMKVSGWFDGDKKELVCAKNRHDFLEILVHEFSHLTQWAEQCDVWVNIGNSYGEMDEWLKGKQVRNIYYHLSKCRDLELDNEKRSVKNIKKFKLSIDIDRYIRKANAYVIFYNWMGVTRKWCTPKNSPYNNNKLIYSMSNKFNMNYKTMSKKVEKAFKEANI